jgi:hypothetical protein
MAKMRVLKSGETDINSTDIWRFVLHEGYPVYKIFQKGSLTVTSNTADSGGYLGQATITHNLGYRPQTFVFANFSSYPPYSGGQQIRMADVTGFYTFYYDDSFMDVSQNNDTTTQYFEIWTPESGKQLTFYYIIMLDEV